MIEAILTILLVFIPFFVPGIGLLPKLKDRSYVDGAIIVLLVSLLTYLLGSFLCAFIGIPVISVVVLSGVILLILLGLWWKEWKQNFLPFLWMFLGTAVPFLFIFGMFSIPYLLHQDGLPTGDIQKAIYWGQFTATTHSLPPYSISPSQLNRDPVDFYTPALHSFMAIILALSPTPLVSAGLVAIAFAIIAAFLAGALAYHIFAYNKAWPAIAVLAVGFVLTNIRFLRYLREPGYHFQNSVGEVLLFAITALGLSLLKTKHPLSHIILIILTAITLVFTHQFTAFIAAFVGIPIALTLLIQHRKTIRQYVLHHLIIVGGSIIALVALAVSLRLYEKIPSLFTFTPHLLSLVPPLVTYPVVMGTVWFLTGCAGLLVFALQKENRSHLTTISYIGIVIVLFALSQGPRWFIDIPPVRALFYMVVPLSVLSAYFFIALWQRFTTYFQTSISLRILARLGIIGCIIIPAWMSTTNAYTSTSPLVRTNSTLQADHLFLNTYLTEHSNPSDGVLIDDYNQRSASWLILSGRPMYTRIAADLERQMEESSQSPLRKQLYEAQLDFEKIFSLGSNPEIVDVLAKHAIRYVTGITGSSDLAFQHNPALKPVAYGNRITLYEVQNSEINCLPDTVCHWLVRNSTLVNDIGDQMDTFEHLPASIRASRLSDPQYDNNTTYRTTTDLFIPLEFNIGDYVRALWDKDKNGKPDGAIDLYVAYTGSNEPLQATTTTGSTYTVPSQTPIRIPADEIVIDDRGFITFTLQNPTALPIHIDSIAAGLSRIP